VELLIDDEQAVNDLVALVGILQSGVSRHLRIRALWASVAYAR